MVKITRIEGKKEFIPYKIEIEIANIEEEEDLRTMLSTLKSQHGVDYGARHNLRVFLDILLNNVLNK